MDHRLEARAAQGRKLKSLYRYLGFTASSLASFLKVSDGTVYRWQRTGDVPFAVIRLLRLMSYQELPGKTWEGWHFSRGALWTPEGHGFDGKDFAWLSLTWRKSQMFGVLYRERQDLREKLREARADLAKAEEQAITAEGRAGVLELAVWGLVARERRGLSTAGIAGDRAQRDPGETRSALRGGLVTRSGSLTGETGAPHLPHGETLIGSVSVTDELLAEAARLLPDGTDFPWRTPSADQAGGAQ